MKAQTIDIQESTGRILSSAVFRPCGKKLMAKGHILREEDIRILQSEGLGQIWVAQLDEDEVGEDEAVCGVAGEMAAEKAAHPGGFRVAFIDMLDAIGEHDIRARIRVS